MVHGNLVGVGSLSLGGGKNEGRSESDDSVVVQRNSKSTIPLKFNSLSTRMSNDNLAKEERVGRELYDSTVKADQRQRFLGSLCRNGVGTNRVEKKQIRSRNELTRDTGWVR